MNWKACELRGHGAVHENFYRVIRSGHTVVVRFGRLGSPGQRLVKTFEDETDAHNLAVVWRYDKINKDHYYEVYSDEFWELGSGFEMSPLPGGADAIEQRYLDRWRATTVRGVDGGPKQWVVLTDLVHLSRGSLEARFVLEKIKEGPHAVDVSRDLTLAAISDPRAVRRDTRIGMEVLGCVSGGDTPDVLKAALGLYNAGTNHASSLMATARRVAGAANQEAVA